VLTVEHAEAATALNQAAREIGQRYDFKNVGASIAWSGDAVAMAASSEDRVKAVLEVFKEKLVRRGVSLKAVDAGEPRASGKEYRITAALKQGIAQEDAKRIGK